MKRIQAIRFAAGTVSAAMGLAALQPCLAQGAANGYPKEPVRVIVPYAAGGATDIIGRAFAQAIGANLKQTFVIENKGGAGQVIGTDFVARAAPNGNTLLLGTVTHAVNATLVPKLPYDSIKDFSPATILASSPLVCVVPAALGIRSLPDLIKAAKADPHRFSYASSGPGSPGQLAVEAIKHAAGISMVHIPYKGAGQTTADLLSGRVQFFCVSPIPIAGQLKDGSLVPLAVTSADRTPVLPDVPSIRETGLQVDAIDSWYGILAPAGTPPAILDVLYKAAKASLEDEGVKKVLKENGLKPIVNTPQEADAYVREEIVKWRKMLQAANITNN
ncbi:tripartite tricarboxylate transporter substrate binding protein [Pigmentiphaga soli]|uniref:Tripartite tricarboxylate transporter substrate binding protein n=1 Tax=Pigmentiphaga soli TaxID=1007095 RepID=A0ABP8HP23_9BURK